ncbi:hypothetical protein [Fusobacterium canifelinum]|uniref:Uncharacterized protein n=1 Tax=Fusobacterium canifelinum TaxID=285729 RepID=A0A3P1UKY4_9FUSO|nr:hypothetical protein [Fusobacterium canifelinum]RRD22157.1 hypothetical protein EII27_10080 [Fusobacterium canifelinum]
MHLFFLTFFLLLLISAIFFTIFEINFVKHFFKIENTKYIVLLRILETMTPFVTLVIASGPRAILKSVFPVFCFLCFLYIVILIVEFFRKKINMKELIVNSVLCFIDIALVTVGLIMIFGF